MPIDIDVVRASSAGLELQDVLKQSTSQLLGVSDGAATVLSKVGIKTIFDLGTSNLFASARAVMEMMEDGVDRFGLVSNDLLSDEASYSSVSDIPGLSIAALRVLTPAQATELAETLDVKTIRDISLWPPYLSARQLVGEAVGATADPEDIQTEELRPRMGQYPTERVYYSTLVMLETLGDSGPSEDLIGAISLMPAVSSGSLTKPAIGALLTFSQSWYSQGVTLGHMLHSLALAPGEATRIAVIDWSRRTSTTATEAISETEALDSTSTHSRALSEVQNAVAKDFEQGGSVSSSSAKSSSRSYAGASGSGLLGGLIGGSDSSEGWQSAQTESWASSQGWSSGTRSVLAAMTQDVNDRTEQHSSDVRNRRATAVREVSQSEHEQVSTRVVANYNHMHALTVQYYEVVQVYRAEAKLHRADRCFFLPMETLDFSEPNGMRIVERFRSALIRAALNRRIRSLLIDETPTIAVKPAAVTKFVAAHPSARVMSRSEIASRIVRRAETASATIGPDLSPDTATEDQSGHTEELPLKGLRFWDSESLERVSHIIDRPIIRADSDWLHIPEDIELLSISFDDVNVKSIRLDRIGTRESAITVVDGCVDLPQGIPMIEVAEINIVNADDEAKSGSMLLSCSYQGRRFTLPAVPIQLKKSAAMQAVVTFANDRADRVKELLQHLQNEREYYSRAIFRSLDSGALISILSHYTWNGKRLIDIVEPTPLRVAGNYLILRAPVDRDESSGLSINSEPASWGDYLSNRGLEMEQASSVRIIPIPTGGVFAEAVLGRSNSAEKLDMTRFWHWQDSPIPLPPTEISPISTGSRATPEDLTPGQLSAPVLNIVSPTNLPAPDSLAAVLNALSSLNFRDMSGLAGTQQLASAGMQGTLRAASEAGQLASENLKTEAQKAVAMGQIVADVIKSLAGKTGGGSGSGLQGDGMKGISSQGAMINQGKDMDKRGIPSQVPSGADAGGTSADGKAGSAGKSVDGGTGGKTSSAAGNSEPYGNEATAFNSAMGGGSVGALGGVIESFLGAGAESPQASAGSGAAWPKLRADVVIPRLQVLKTNPNEFDQGGIGLCTAAAFYHHIIQKKPDEFYSYALDLYKVGSGYIGKLKVKPGSDLRNADYSALAAKYPGAIPREADWMLMSALRDSENWFFDYEGRPDESIAMSTSAKEMSEWYQETGYYSSVTYSDDTSLAKIKTLLKTPSNQIALWVKVSLLGDSRDATHMITLESPMVIDETQNTVSFDYWTWGQPVKTLNTSVDALKKDFLGAIVAEY